MTSATTALIKVDVPFAAALESQTRIIARNVPQWRKTEMAVLKSLIWEAQKPICFMRERNMDLRKDN